MEINYVDFPKIEPPTNMTLNVSGPLNQLSTLQRIAGGMISFVGNNTRGKINLHVNLNNKPFNTKGLTIDDSEDTGCTCDIPDTMDPLDLPITFHCPAVTNLKFKPGANNHYPQIGQALAKTHEWGHGVGLGHSHTRMWKDQITVAYIKRLTDPFDPVNSTNLGFGAYNPPHLYFLGWFNTCEIAYAESGKTYTLNLYKTQNPDFTTLKVLFYQVPGASVPRLYWFSYQGNLTGKMTPSGMPSTGIAIHSCLTTSAANTYYEGLIGPKFGTHIRTGLIFNLSNILAVSVDVTIILDPNWVLENGTSTPTPTTTTTTIKKLKLMKLKTETETDGDYPK